MNRRSMSKLVIAAGAGVLLPSNVESAKNISLSFEFNHDWLKLPENLSEGFQFGLTHGVAVDSQDRVYVAHTGHVENTFKDCVMVFDPDGNFLNSWGEQFFGGAHGLDIFKDKDGSEVLYLTDLKRGLFKMNLSGEVLWHVPKPPSMEGGRERWRPSNVAVSNQGVVFLADGYGSHKIFALDSEGNELFHFGGTGDHEEGKTFHPHGLWIDERPGNDPYLVIAENYNRNERYDFHGVLLRYHLDGTYHDTIETEHGLISPRHFTSFGDILAIPDLDGRVTLLDKDFHLIDHLGDIDISHDDIRELRKDVSMQDISNKFVCPHDAAYDSKGNLYIAEWVVGGRFTRLSPKQILK